MKWIAYIGSSRFCNRQVEITDRLWPEADGWLRPARLSLSRLLDFLALRSHTAENLGEWQNE